MSALLSAQQSVPDIDGDGVVSVTAFPVLDRDQDMRISASLAFAVWWDMQPFTQRCEMHVEHAVYAFKSGWLAGYQSQTGGDA